MFRTWKHAEWVQEDLSCKFSHSCTGQRLVRFTTSAVQPHNSRPSYSSIFTAWALLTSPQLYVSPFVTSNPSASAVSSHIIYGISTGCRSTHL